MGMSIDKVIDVMERYEMYGYNAQKEGRNKAIDIMRKYEKIERIVSDFRKYQKGITWGFGGEKYMQMVSEVVEDGTN